MASSVQQLFRVQPALSHSIMSRSAESSLSVKGEITGGIWDRKGRDKDDPSLSASPLYKGFSEDLGRDGPKMFEAFK